MNYCCRDGIILTKICGEYLLVAATNCREYCPGVTHINETAADIWKLLKERKTAGEIRQYLTENYETEDTYQLDEMIAAFLENMKDKGYLIPEGRNE